MSAPQIQYPPTSGGGTPTGGSGTANTIPRWDAGSPSTTLTDSGLIDNGTAVYTSTRRVGVDTSTTLANVKFQVGSASALSNYQGAPFGVILPAGSGSWLEFAENSTNGTAFRITKDSNTGVILNANGKDVGFDAGAYESLISGCQMVLKTSGFVGIGTASPGTKLDVADTGTPSGTVGIRSLYTGTITANAGGVLALGGYFTGTSPTTFAYIVGGKDNATAGDFGGHIQFITRPNGGVYTERARIDSAGNVGIGVIPSAWASSVRAEEMRTHARWNYNSGSDSVAYWTVNAFLNSAGNAIYKATAAASQYTQIGGAHVWERAVSGTAGNTVTWLESARIDSAGNFGIGTTSPDSRLHVTLAGLASLRIGYAGTSVNYYDAGTHNFRDGGGNPAFTITAGATKIADLSVSGWGLKLPNAPNNGDPNTLDSYREGTRTLSAGDLSGWTYVTATQYWTLVGRTVTLHTVFSGGTSSATGGATIATPPLLTPLRIAAGSAVNSSGTALGNGVCVCGPSTATTGVVQTSNAISSSAVDKVITVTYETAGL